MTPHQLQLEKSPGIKKDPAQPKINDFFKNMCNPMTQQFRSLGYLRQNVGVCSDARLCPTLASLWTIAHQVPLSTGFPRQEYWSGLPFPPPGDVPDPGIKPKSSHLLHWQVDSLLTSRPGQPLQQTDALHSYPHPNPETVNLLQTQRRRTRSADKVQVAKKPTLKLGESYWITRWAQCNPRGA